MKSTYLHVKHAPNNIQGVQKIFDQDSVTIDVPTTTFEGEKVKQESFNIHFAEVNHNGEENEVN